MKKKGFIVFISVSITVFITLIIIFSKKMNQNNNPTPINTSISISSDRGVSNSYKKTIKVSINESWPDSFLDPHGVPRGLFIDMLDEIGRKESLNIIYIMDEWKAGLEKLKNGEVDLKVSLAYTKERDLIYDFSKEPAYVDWANVIINDLNIQSILDLNSKKVALTKGGFFPKEFQDLCVKFDIYPEFIKYTTDEEILRAVAEKKVDAGVIPHMFGVLNSYKYNVKMSSIVFSPVGVYFATQDGKNSELLDIIDKYLKLWKKDQNSIYYQIMNKWLYSEKTRLAVPNWLYISILISIFLVIFLFFWIRLLRYQVKKRTAALEESEERLKLVLDGSQTGYWDWNIKTGEVKRNERWAEMLGYTLQEIEFSVKQWTDLHHPDDREVAWKSIEDHLEGRTNSHRMEYRMLGKDGKYRWILDSAKVVKRDKDGKPIRMAGIHTDITAMKEAEQKIKSLLLEKELLLKEVHHRIKNNMSTIKGLLTLQISAESDQSVISSLKDAENRVQSMIMLYEKLYCTDNFRELSIKDYLEPLAKEIIGSYSNNSIVEIKTHIEDFIINIQLLTPIGIIVNELLTNIMKYAFTEKKHGTVSIFVSLNEGHVSLIVQDDGNGIPENIDFKNSTGFGMQLVYMLTQQIEGKIGIERVGGTKVILEFDLFIDKS